MLLFLTRRAAIGRHQVDTYGAVWPDTGIVSQGGYASHVRTHEHWVFPIPDALPTTSAAPMLCAGLTAFSPLVRNGCGPGKKVGIVGLGGIGHFGVLFAKACTSTLGVKFPNSVCFMRRETDIPRGPSCLWRLFSRKKI